jgi:hypothetical protein
LIFVHWIKAMRWLKYIYLILPAIALADGNVNSWQPLQPTGSSNYIARVGEAPYKYGYPSCAACTVEPNVVEQFTFSEESGDLVGVVASTTIADVNSPTYSVAVTDEWKLLTDGITSDADPSYFAKASATAVLDIDQDDFVIELVYSTSEARDNRYMATFYDGTDGYMVVFRGGAADAINTYLKADDGTTINKVFTAATQNWLNDGNYHKIRIIGDRSGDQECKVDGTSLGTVTLATLVGKDIKAQQAVFFNSWTGGHVFLGTFLEYRLTVGNSTNCSRSGGDCL